MKTSEVDFLHFMETGCSLDQVNFNYKELNRLTHFG